MRDKYNLNLLPKDSEEVEYEEELPMHAIPGMGFGDRNGHEEEELPSTIIPGFGFDQVDEEPSNESNGQYNDRNYKHSGRDRDRKVPYSKPIPKQFQQQWNSDSKQSNDRSRNDRRNVTNDSYYSQGFDNNSPQHDRFQQPIPTNNQSYNNASNHEFYNNSPTQFQPPSQPPLPPPFFNLVPFNNY